MAPKGADSASLTSPRVETCERGETTALAFPVTRGFSSAPGFELAEGRLPLPRRLLVALPDLAQQPLRQLERPRALARAPLEQLRLPIVQPHERLLLLLDLFGDALLKKEGARRNEGGGRPS